MLSQLLRQLEAQKPLNVFFGITVEVEAPTYGISATSGIYHDV